MAQFEKTLKGDLKEIVEKITLGVTALSPSTGLRGSWSTTAGDVKCTLLVFEKVAPRIWVEGEHRDQPHYTLSVTLVDTGEEIRLCAIAAGSNLAPYFIPEAGPEGALLGALKTTVDILDLII